MDDRTEDSAGMTGQGTGASQAPHSAASAAGQSSAAAALAFLARGGRGGKTPGKTGLATALEAAPGKGKASFLDLVMSQAKKNKAPTLDAAAAVKDLAAKAAAAATKAAAAGTAPQPADAAATAAGTAAVQDDRNGKKKAAPAPGTAMAVSLLALVPADGQKQAAAKPAAADGPTDLKATATAAHAPVRGAEPVVRVVDLRSKAKPSVSSEEAAAAKIASQTGQGDKDTGTSFAQKLVSFHDAPADRAAPPASAAAPSAATPAAALDRLREMAGSELLKATNLVLKDGGGEIRLVLKPESLGSVRIRMNMVDNKIEGRIVVDSSTVKAVFDANIDALRRALTAEGFNTGALQVSVGGQNTDADPRKEQQPPEAVRRVTAQGFERNIPGAESMSLGDLLVNLFV